MQEHPEVAIETPEAFLDNPLFADIASVVKNGISTPNGFRAMPDFKKDLSREQTKKLLDLRHTLYTQYNLISLWVNKVPRLDELSKEPMIKEMIEDLASDPFVKELVKHHEAGKLSKQDLIYRLKEDVYWRVKFAEWDVLQMEKLKKTDTEKYSAEKLSLEDIQDETRAELGISVPKM